MVPFSKKCVKSLFLKLKIPSKIKPLLHSERCAANNEFYVPENPRKKCTGSSYIGPKLYNMIPKDIKEAKTTDDFKTKLKGWIWKNIH